MEIQTNFLSDQEIKQIELNHKLAMDGQRLLMDKVDLLENLLTALKPGQKAFGDETVYVPALSEDNADIVEREIMKLIKKIC